MSGTMIAAHKAGIPIFATGGIGGVHRGVEESKYFVLAWPLVCFSAFHRTCGCGALHSLPLCLSVCLSVCASLYLLLLCVCVYIYNLIFFSPIKRCSLTRVKVIVLVLCV